MLEANLPERFQNLTAAVIDAMRLSHEGHHDVLVGGFVEQHFEVTRRYDLRAGAPRGLGQQRVYLALAENFEVCVRLVEQQRRAGIGVNMHEQQQRLLNAAAGARQIEFDAPVYIGEFDGTARQISLRLQKFDSEYVAHFPGNRGPVLGVRLRHPKAQISEHLRGLTFADESRHAPRLKLGLIGRQAGHRGQQRHGGAVRFWRHRHPLLPSVQPDGPAVQGLSIGVLEFEAAGPRLAAGFAIDDHVDEDMMRVLGAFVAADRRDTQVMPESSRLVDRRMGQRLTVQRHAGFQLGATASLWPASGPFLKPTASKRQRLQR